MSWLRRLLLLAGLLTGVWLLGSSGEANADVRVEIDRLEIEVGLPVVDIGLKIETAPKQPDVPVPPKPDLRVEPPTPPAAPQQALPPVEAPARPEVSQQQQLQQQHTSPQPPPPAMTHPTNSEPAPPQPQPQAEQPVPGTLPQSGAGSSTSNQIPAGTLPHVLRPPATTASPVRTERQDVPHTVRAEEPTFSPD